MTRMILHPTRGGKASYPNQNWVIQQAAERGAEILFLYVSDVHFLGQTMMPKLVDLEAELDEMGDFLLAMAQERAQQAGVEAQTIVRRGVFNQVLREVIEEYPIDLVVLGSSSAKTGITTREYLDTLALEINRHAGVELVILYEGKVLIRYGSE